MLEIIPVVDILSGIVVQAKAGERKNYRPIESSLCKSKDPIKIISALYNKTNSNVFYIIMGSLISIKIDLIYINICMAILLGEVMTIILYLINLIN